MSIVLLVGVGVLVTLLLHLAGWYTRSLKIAWAAIIFLWTVAIGTLMNEIKSQGYIELKAMQGKYKDTDALISQAGKRVSFYEFMRIKESYLQHQSKKED